MPLATGRWSTTPVVSRDDLVGSWRLDDETIEFAADGTFKLKTRGPGTWDLNRWNLFLSSKTGSAEEWRVIEVDGAPALVRNWRDMDLSSSDPYFERVPPAHRLPDDLVQLEVGGLVRHRAYG